MIDAIVGRFVLRCIEAARQQTYERKMASVDIGGLPDEELSALVHGRGLAPDEAPPRAATPDQVRRLRQAARGGVPLPGRRVWSLAPYFGRKQS